MNLLKKLILNRITLIGLTVFSSIITIFVSLLWNAQLSLIINRVNIGIPVPLRAIIFAGIIMLVSSCMTYVLGICSSWTCETLAHDLRMGYAKKCINLTIMEIENMNAGEQLSKLQNEINDVSGFLRANMFSIIDDLIRFVGSFFWLLWLNPKLTLLANVPAALLMWYTLYASKVIGQAALKSQQANANMAGFADTLITLFPILRLSVSVAVRFPEDRPRESQSPERLRRTHKLSCLMKQQVLLIAKPVMRLLQHLII